MSLRSYGNRITMKAHRIARLAAVTPLSWLSTENRAAALEHLIEQMQITVETPRGQIRYYIPTPLLASRGKGMLSKETDTIRWIDSFPNDCVFWDIGANVGVYSLYAAARSNVSVISFEPLAANFHVLCRNIEINGLGARITAYCAALSGVTELGVLNMASSSMGSALSQFGRPGEMSPYCTNENKTGPMHGMIGYSIDDFISQFEPAFPNYLKMDVDGLEWQILQGAQKTLRDARLHSLVVELSLSNQKENLQAVTFLEKSGFRLRSVGNMQGTEVGQAANHLFER